MGYWNQLDPSDDKDWGAVIRDIDSSGNVLFEGRNTSIGASTSDTTWYIWKSTILGEDIVKEQGPLIGIWDDRGTLDWSAAWTAGKSQRVSEDNIILQSFLLENIFKELKKMNMHLSFITDKVISNKEIS